MKKIFAILIAFFLLQVTIIYNAGADSFSDGDGILYTEPLKAVLFSHKKHVGDKKLSCDKCHSGLFEMEALWAEKKNDFNMESLYQGKYCGACHNGKKAFASDTQCASCHVRFDELKPGYVKGKEPKTGAAIYKTKVTMGRGEKQVRFKHETHTKSAKCRDCHSLPFKIKTGSNRITLAEHGKDKYCFGCHNGKKTFSWYRCNECHKNWTAIAQIGPLKAKAEKGSCYDCHTSDSELKSLVKPPNIGGEGEG